MAGIASKAKNLGPRNKTIMFFRTRENDSSKACENKKQQHNAPFVGEKRDSKYDNIAIRPWGRSTNSYAPSGICHAFRSRKLIRLAGSDNPISNQKFFTHFKHLLFSESFLIIGIQSPSQHCNNGRVVQNKLTGMIYKCFSSLVFTGTSFPGVITTTNTSEGTPH